MAIPHILIVVMSFSRVSVSFSRFCYCRKTLAFLVALGFLPPCSALAQKPRRPKNHLRGALLWRRLFQ